MNNREIALDVLQEHLKPYTQRPNKLATVMLEFIIKFEQSDNVHSRHLKGLYKFWRKVPKENYIKQISNSYQNGVASKKYQYGTELIKLRQEILRRIIDNVQELDTKVPTEQDILFKTKDIHKLESISLLINKSYQYKNSIIIEDRNQQQSVYFENVGRSYSIFSQLPKRIRQLTNTPIEIDLSTSVQNVYLNQYSIMNNITYKEALKEFPCHSEYTNNKNKIRNKLAKEYIKSVSELEEDILDLVKTFITKISFKGSSEKEIKEKFKNPEFILGLFSETKRLTKPIISLINKLDDRTIIKKHITNNLNRKKDEQCLKRSKVGSKLFFYYEYQENKIREAMIEFANDSHAKSVHDAIYVTQEQDINEMKKYIFTKTGFTVSL